MVSMVYCFKSWAKQTKGMKTRRAPAACLKCSGRPETVEQLFLPRPGICRSAAFRPQVVGNAERPGNRVGLDTRDVLVGFVRDYAFEGDLSVIHNDVNRRDGA